MCKVEPAAAQRPTRFSLRLLGLLLALVLHVQGGPLRFWGGKSPGCGDTKGCASSPEREKKDRPKNDVGSRRQTL